MVARPPESAAALEARLGYRFAVPDRLEQALTHPSWSHEHAPAEPNEALAFLGDAVVGLAVADLLRARTPNAGPGPLTRQRAELVSARNLARWAIRLGLPGHLRLGRGEEQGGGRGKESVLATALEAVVGAIYLDGGLAAAHALVAALIDGGDETPPVVP